MRRGVRIARTTFVAGAALAALSGVGALPGPVPTPAALAQDPDLRDSPSDLIEDAKAALDLARGWVRRADDANLDYAQRRDGRVEATRLLKIARGKLQAALELDPKSQRSVDPILTETMRLLAGVRKSSGLGETPGPGDGEEPKGAPPPRDDRPPTARDPAPADAPPRRDDGPAGEGTSGTEPAPPVPTPPVTVVAWEDWDRQYREVAARPDLTSAARVESLRELARDKAIEFRGKILDVAPATGHGEGALLLRVCGIYGDTPSRTFLVDPADRQAVADWSRWDRIVWRERIDVQGVDQVVYRPIYRTPSDLARTPDPGIQYPVDVRSIDSATAWQSNLRRFAEEVLRNRWRSAYGALRRTAAREYEIPGEVEGVTLDGAVVRPKGNQALETRDGRRFGPPRGTVTVKIDDPQARALAVVGAPVMLGLTIEPPDSALALFQAKGTIECRWRFHRLRPTGSK